MNRAAMLLLSVLIGGCGHTTYYMASDSAIPRRWAEDPRTAGWDGFAIRYILRQPDEVEAEVGERRSGGRSFTAVGTYQFDPYDGPRPWGQAQTLRATFDGMEEAYRVYQMNSVFILLPDGHSYDLRASPERCPECGAAAVQTGCTSADAVQELELGVSHSDALASLARHGVHPRRDEGAYGFEGNPPIMRYAIDTPKGDDLLHLYFTRRPRWMSYRLEQMRWYHNWREDVKLAKGDRAEDQTRVTRVAVKDVAHWVRTGDYPPRPSDL